MFQKNFTNLAVAPTTAFFYKKIRGLCTLSSCFAELNAVIAFDQEKNMYHHMLNAMDKECRYFYDTFQDSYEHLSGWGHAYFCNEDGGKLLFNLDQPHEHVCQICGKVYTGEKFDNIWTYFYRNEAFLTLWKSAVLYKTRKDNTHLEIFKKIFTYYAENYLNFVIHVKDKVNAPINLDIGGAGRLMPQGLNEAIVTVRALCALEIIKDDLDTAFIDMLKIKFFDEIVALLKPQVTEIHNIPCWKNCAIGMIGLFFDDPSLVDFSLNSELGLWNQLQKGVSGDNFWYEGSIHYNFFILEGLTNLLLFSKQYNHPVAFLETYVENMLTSAFEYAFDNSILPNPNDGWPNITLKTYSYIYETAARYFGEDSNIGNLLKNIVNSSCERVFLPLSKPYFYEDICLEQLTFNASFQRDHYTKFTRDSVLFKNSFFAMLRQNDVNVFCKYGLLGKSHAHPDKMNIEILIGNKLLSRDLSNAGYGASLCNEWHRMTASHNTVVVDGENQNLFDGGEILHFDDHSFEVKTSGNEGVTFIRNVVITENKIADKFSVSSEKEHEYDYFFHCEGELLSELSTEDYIFNFNANGYQHIKDCKKVLTTDQRVVLNWKLGDKNLTSTIDLNNGADFIIAKTYDNPVSTFRTSFIVRTKNTNTNFNILWEVTK